MHTNSDELDPSEAAALLHMTDRGIIKMAKRGELPIARQWQAGRKTFYRFRRADVEAEADRRGIKAGP
jgi:excisionase family DNA binding protein